MQFSMPGSGEMINIDPPGFQVPSGPVLLLQRGQIGQQNLELCRSSSHHDKFITVHHCHSSSTVMMYRDVLTETYCIYIYSTYLLHINIYKLQYTSLYIYMLSTYCIHWESPCSSDANFMWNAGHHHLGAPLDLPDPSISKPSPLAG